MQKLTIKILQYIFRWYDNHFQTQWKIKQKFIYLSVARDILLLITVFLTLYNLKKHIFKKIHIERGKKDSNQIHDMHCNIKIEIGKSYCCIKIMKNDLTA